jgi:hypothetical protein
MQDMIMTSLKEELGILLFSASACLPANQQNKFIEIPSHFSDPPPPTKNERKQLVLLFQRTPTTKG